MNSQTQQGIAALKAGNRKAAQQILGTVVTENPQDIQAWLWLSGAVEQDEERINCLQQVLRLDPGNQAAARGLAQILERRTKPAAASSEPVSTLRAVVTAQADFSAQLEEDEETAISNETDSHQEIERLEAALRTAPDLPTAPVKNAVSNLPGTPPAHDTALPSAETSPARVVFRVRPSLVPVILSFWVVVGGVWLLNYFLRSDPQASGPVTLGVAGLLMLTLAYTLVRIFLIRYELTTHDLSIPFKGKQVQISIHDILQASSRQNGFQKVIQTGDVVVEAGVQGVLQQIRLQNLANYQHRVEQIMYLVQDQR